MAKRPGTMEELVRLRSDFWAGRRVLLTGHTGFKGSWLALWLARMGAVVTGLSLPPATKPALFELARVADGLEHHTVDIRDAQAVREAVRTCRPEIVLHLAAQALVRPGYRAPLDTWSTNVLGTANVLEALRGQADVRVALVVTTDKVYRNREWVWPYREDDGLGGHDPYSASKAAAELAVASWRDAFLVGQGVAVASARAGNVIGGGDWAEDRLIPDAVRAFGSGQTLRVRRPDAVRPWQHVLEPLAAYLVLAQKLWQQPDLPSAWNFGPASDTAASVRTVVDWARQAYGHGNVVYGDGREGPHEAGMLALDVSRARQLLGVSARWDLATSVRRTMAWYRAQADGGDARALCLADIEAYERAPV